MKEETTEPSELGRWLETLGLGQYIDSFVRNNIDFGVLSSLTEQDFREMGLTIGHRRVLAAAIKERQKSAQTASLGVGDEERRQLTVMFCDVVGATALSSRLDPEDLRAAMHLYYTACGNVIERHGGFVAQYLGDGILAYFGYPLAQEDAAERAVRAGLDILSAVAELEVPDGSRMAVRLGAATGLAVVGGRIGRGAAEQHSVVGQTPNLAARIQMLAAHGTFAITDSTKRLVGGHFRYENLGQHTLKGIDGPVQVWQVAGELKRQTRFEALHAEVTACIGRDDELKTIDACWRQAAEGDGQAVMIVGEAGIGKSRLLRMVSDHFLSLSPRQILLQCSPHHTANPLHPVIAEISQTAGIDRRDTDETNLARIETWLGRLADRQSIALVADLLSLPLAGYQAALPQAPDRRKSLIRDLMITILETLCDRHPVLFMVEDAHWMDGATEDLLHRLIDRLRTRRFMAVVTTRPEYEAPWRQQPYTTVILLEKLRRDAVEQVIRNTSAGKPLPAAIVDQIVAKTDGVPLFIEELTKAILESGHLRTEGEALVLDGELPTGIPTTLHDSLMARLDRLGGVKEVAQFGSALGRTYSYELLAAVMRQPADNLTAALNRLVEAGLMFQRGTPPAALYTFKHALVQDAAYESLLRSKRQELHAHIVDAIEREFPETARSDPSLLAHHCQRANLPDREVDYLYAAGLASTRLVAVRESLFYFAKAEETLSRLEVNDRNIARHINIILGLMDVGRFGILPSRLIELAAKARSLFANSAFRDDPEILASILFQEGRAQLYTSRYHDARESFYTLVQIGHDVGSEEIVRMPGSALTMSLCCQGYFNESLDYINVSNIDYYRRSGSIIDYIAGLGWTGYATCQVSGGDDGLVFNDRALEESEQFRSQMYIAGAHVWKAHALIACRRADEAIVEAQRCVDIARSVDVPYLVWHGLMFLAMAQCRAQQFAAAEETIAAVRSHLASVPEGLLSVLDYLPAIEAEIACFSGDTEAAVAVARRAIAVGAAIGGRFAEATARRTMAVALLNTGGGRVDEETLTEAEGHFARAMTLFQEGGAHAERAFGTQLWSAALRRAGETERAAKAAQAADVLAAMFHFDLRRTEFGAAARPEPLVATSAGLQPSA